MDYGYKPTTKGREILAACMALGAPLELTRVLVGSGRVSEDTNLADVHELLQYVTTGYIGDRRHENDRLYLDIQYQNDKDHANVPAFMLGEFIVYAINPATGKEEDLLYATLGDYLQSIPPYAIGFPTGIWQFPIVLIVSDEINVSVTAPAGLVTYSDLIKLFNSRSAGAAKMDITIPASGWAKDQDTGGAYPIHMDIASTDITEAMIPMLTIIPSSLEAARVCGLCPVSRTMPGALRLYAKSVPPDAISASLTLLDTAPQHSGLASSAATARMDIILPADGWVEDTDTGGEYPVHFDMVDEVVQDNLIPLLTVYPEHLNTAGNCNLSPYIRTIPGALRVYAKRPPDGDIKASLALLGVYQSMVGGTPGGGGAYVLPAASATVLGGVRVREGSGLVVDGSGNIAIDAAADLEAEDIYNGSKVNFDQE